ncbi:MAG TPA: hypothetical protein ENJ82_06245, partial [Bacteroidetes bacterium]|nr:hypothetical protein [Bacteroidota bacterium]
ATFLVLQGALVVFEWGNIGLRQLEFFLPDQLSIVFLAIGLPIAVFVYFHYVIYAQKRGESLLPIRLHNSMFILFLISTTGIFLTDHFGMLWVFMEGTTISGAILIYHDRGKLVLEAVWKYLFVCSFSIALAFAGILFLSIGIQEAGFDDLSMKGVAAAASQVNPLWLQASFLFVLVGFSVKLGSVPMFNVDIDAKDVSPSPVGALFSSILLNAGFVAIFRFYLAFSDSEIRPWMDNVLLISGLLTLIFAATLMLRVRNFKRLFGYSSMEHAGIALIAMSLGPKGWLIAVLHLCFHALIKSGLFIQIGQVHRVFNSKIDGEAGGYFYQNPAGALVLLLSTIAVLALPPSGLFMTEFMAFSELIQVRGIWLSVFVMVLLLIVLFAMGKLMLRLLFVVPKGQNSAKTLVKISPWESLTQFIGLAAVLGFGLYLPPDLMEWLGNIFQNL